jgi:hypothetical protein
MAPLGLLSPTILIRVKGLTLAKRLHGSSSPVAAGHKDESQ